MGIIVRKIVETMIPLNSFSKIGKLHIRLY